MADNFGASSDYTRFNVMSSRVRLARNVEGMPFPNAKMRVSDADMNAFTAGAVRAAEGLFEYGFFRMRDLGELQKTALVERHLISPALARNSATGAVILENTEGISVMLNEEDRVREQCVAEGFNLRLAHARISRYDDNLCRELPVAYDDRLGFLTACPTNLGTGMRASTMLFLPALKLAGAIESALTRFVKDYGLTVRGVYGEGSEALGDMYQLSNTRTLGLTEEEILSVIERATVEMCMNESRAREKLARKAGAQLYDKIARSYGVLTNAYMLTSAELMRLISDVKLGVILNILPLKDTKTLDKLLVFCSAANLALQMGNASAGERDIVRAALVKRTLEGGAQR